MFEESNGLVIEWERTLSPCCEDKHLRSHGQVIPAEVDEQWFSSFSTLKAKCEGQTSQHETPASQTHEDGMLVEHAGNSNRRGNQPASQTGV